MICETVEELTPIIGTRPACRALGASPATVYRRRRPPQPRPSRPRPVPARALSEAEREAVLAELHSDRFADSSPAQVWATLLDGSVDGDAAGVLGAHDDLFGGRGRILAVEVGPVDGGAVGEVEIVGYDDCAARLVQAGDIRRIWIGSVE
jgi:hypothetical protein